MFPEYINNFYYDHIVTVINILGVVLGFAFGVVAQKYQFCFSGCIKDYFLFNCKKRMCSVVMAIISSIIFTQIVFLYFDIDYYNIRYFSSNINDFSIIFGGCLFGIGMMLCDGCASRHLVKFAQGDLNSLITIIFVGIFAFITTKGILSPLVMDFVNSKNLIAHSLNFKINIYFILIVLLALLFIFMKKIKRIVWLYDGAIVGILISIGWIITSFLGRGSIDKYIPNSSFSFVYPSANALEFLSHYSLVDFSYEIAIVFGVIFGAFFMSLINKKYNFNCAIDEKTKRNKVRNNIIGGALMGIGGVLSIGCTVGQGLSGMSTLAFSSLLAISSIMSSAFITAYFMNKKNNLIMCFLFEWPDEITKGKK